MIISHKRITKNKLIQIKFQQMWIIMLDLDNPSSKYDIMAFDLQSPFKIAIIARFSCFRR